MKTESIKWFFKSMLTDTCNNAYDIMRVLVFIGSIVYLLISIYVSIFKDSFDFVAFATGYAAILACAGAGIGIKTKLEETSTENEQIRKEKKHDQ